MSGHRIGDDGFIGKWRIVVVRDLPFSDQRLNGKIPKVIYNYHYLILFVSTRILEVNVFRTVFERFKHDYLEFVINWKLIVSHDRF